MKKIMDIIIDDMSIRVYYSNGEVKSMLLDEATEYVYKIAKNEVNDLNKKEKKQIVHCQTSATLLFLAGVSLVIMNAPFTPAEYPAYLELVSSILTTGSITYTVLAANDILKTTYKKKNIVKSLEIIEEELREQNRYDFKPTFLEKIKLSDPNDKFKKRIIKNFILTDINLNEMNNQIEELRNIRRAFSKEEDKNIIILENESKEEKPKALLKTLENKN